MWETSDAVMLVLAMMMMILMNYDTGFTRSQRPKYRCAIGTSIKNCTIAEKVYIYAADEGRLCDIYLQRSLE